jgi:hypothetical protein
LLPTTILALGAGVGHIFHIGRLPVNTQIAAHHDVVHPDNGANRQARLQVRPLFPK